jgi:hypothetical protein
VNENVDFTRMARGKYQSLNYTNHYLTLLVSIEKQLQSRELSQIKVSLLIDPVVPLVPITSNSLSYGREQAESGAKMTELPLASFILSQPIPSGWELRRCTEHTSPDAIYFWHIASSKPTAVLWYDPLYNLAPDTTLEPLPEKYRRVEAGGKVVFENLNEYDSSNYNYVRSSSPPEVKDGATFREVLKPISYHHPDLFGF